jgi:hypothetical protein
MLRLHPVEETPALPAAMLFNKKKTLKNDKKYLPFEWQLALLPSH